MQTLKSAQVAIILVTGLPPGTLGTFNVVYATLDPVRVAKNGLDKAISTHRSQLPPTMPGVVAEPTEKAMGRTQVIQDMEMAPEKLKQT